MGMGSYGFDENTLVQGLLCETLRMCVLSVGKKVRGSTSAFGVDSRVTRLWEVWLRPEVIKSDGLMKGANRVILVYTIVV